jgi:hypothetical protein
LRQSREGFPVIGDDFFLRHELPAEVVNGSLPKMPPTSAPTTTKMMAMIPNFLLIYFSAPNQYNRNLIASVFRRFTVKFVLPKRERMPKIL